jgi:GNAT superfamily N-acetyltransferase
MTDNVRIRPMVEADLEAVRPLLTQLGYDLVPDEIRRRFAAITTAAGHAVFVAESAGQVIGMMHLFARPAFDKPPEIVVQAIVVDAAHRGRGVGKILMAAAEDWAAQRDYRSVSLYSKTARADAHAFYHALGYERVATSHLLRRDLRADRFCQ